MIDEIRVDTSRLHDYANMLHHEQALMNEVAARLDRAKHMVSEEYYGKFAYAQNRAWRIGMYMLELADCVDSVADIFDALERKIPYMMTDYLIEGMKE